jgi:trk system potassium uptake protein TrkA
LVRLSFKRRRGESQVLVIGLGRFGSSVAASLVRQGREVLAVDTDPVLVQRYADDFTHVVLGDATQDEVLAQLGVSDIEHAVVAIGNDIQASVLITLSLAETGVKVIWARAVNRKHGQILDKVGAHRVVYPETTVGEQVAHLILGGMTQFIEIEDDFVIARTSPPRQMWERTLRESVVRRTYGVTVVGVKHPGEGFVYAQPDTLVKQGDDLLVAGRPHRVEEFAVLSTESGATE